MVRYYNNEPKRIAFIDMAKAIAIGLVCFYHTCDADALSDAQGPKLFIHSLLLALPVIAVPLFFTASGFLLLNRPFERKKDLLKILRLIVLMLIWSAITVFVYCLVEDINPPTKELISAVLLFRHGVNNHLWLFKAMVLILLLLPFIQKLLVPQRRKIAIGLFILLFLGTFGVETANWITNIYRYYAGGQRYITFLPQNYAYAFVYFLAGGFIRRRMDARKRMPSIEILIAAFVIALAALLAYAKIATVLLRGERFDPVWFGYVSLPALVMTLSAFAVLSRKKFIKGKAPRLLTSIGEDTLGIYLLHIPVHFLLPVTAPYPMATGSAFIALAYAGMIFTICWALTAGLKKIPIAKLLVEV